MNNFEKNLRTEAKNRGMDDETTEDFVKKGIEWWNSQGTGILKKGKNVDITSSDR